MMSDSEARGAEAYIDNLEAELAAERAAKEEARAVAESLRAAHTSPQPGFENYELFPWENSSDY